MSTVGAFVYDEYTLILTKMPDGVTPSKIGYARFQLSDGTTGSATGTFLVKPNLVAGGGASTVFMTSGPGGGTAANPSAVFMSEDKLFATSTGNNSLGTPIVGLLTYPAANWLYIALILVAAWYLYYHGR